MIVANPTSHANHKSGTSTVSWDDLAHLSAPEVEPQSPPTPEKPKVPLNPVKVPRPVPIDPKSPAKRVPYIEPAPKPRRQPVQAPPSNPDKHPTPRLVPDCLLSPLVQPKRELDV